MSVSGLLTQKPDSPEPQVGGVQRFSWGEKTGKSGKPYIKVKNEGEGYGQPCKVESASKTDFKDTHGNVSFNVTFTPQEDAAGAVGEAPSKGDSAPAAASVREEGMAYAGTFNAAVALTAAQLQNKLISPAEVVKTVEGWMNDLRPIRYRDPKGPWHESEDPESPAAPDTAPDLAMQGDDDIPF